ncbi:3-galactosyl-N-acetylglucosaminide 4-alpha-L-fucosyltransferase FUT3-like [Anomaloglossus baeobatrachus]|uniref:3-galactosyl-N-acetylglucosaminide 4-alpha-L-fucosyltransferase FUT3-like n=1 Tax=Anomaloglossus baeobatrachus TaxID=238106 RepID=UPI003F4F5DF5
MASRKLISQTWAIILILSSFLIFLLFTLYHGMKLPTHKAYSTKQKIVPDCSMYSIEVNSRTLPQQKMSSDLPSLIILLWTWPSGHTFPLNQCPASIDSSNCLFTVDRSLYSVANAVVFHHRDVSGSKSLLAQEPRPPHQYWIWFSLESPSNIRNLSVVDNIMNLTMSYRVDSDIFMPYGRLAKLDKQYDFTIPEKTALVAWLISNWNLKHKRLEYYKELKKHIQIDIYGKHHLPLPSELKFLNLAKYKFYLAFENSIHEDYITEKLWTNSFLIGTVPVVMGPPRKNYERFIPPDSFIHVEDFSSAKELASYLLSLDKDDQKYQRYFNWKSNYQVVKMRSIFETAYCKVCKALKEAPSYRTIPSIAEWFK